jgi:hypothetical protein
MISSSGMDMTAMDGKGAMVAERVIAIGSTTTPTTQMRTALKPIFTGITMRNAENAETTVMKIKRHTRTVVGDSRSRRRQHSLLRER